MNDATPVPTNHPKGFWFIFFGELAERCSFYGMRGLLVLYLVQVFRYEPNEASRVYHLYMAACYFTSIIGGLVADRLLGKYWTIVAFSVPYVIGQILVGQSNETMMYCALILLAFGSGVIKPNISTLMGMTYDQQRPGQERLRSQAFSWFYVAINVGSLFSYIVCPAVKNYVGKVDKDGIPADPEAGYLAAFLIPAGLMAVALVLFVVGKKHYAVEKIAAPAGPATYAERRAVTLRLAGLFVLVMFFWAIFDQKGSTWILFGSKYLDLQVFGRTITSDQLQFLNPCFIILFVPVMNVIYRKLEARSYDLRPTNKMVAGFLLTAACMGLHAVAGYAAVNADGSITRVSILWQALAYVSLTIAEILISITGLELAYTAAPQSMKSFVTSLWLLTVGLANLVVAVPVTQLYPSGKPAVITILGTRIVELTQFRSPGDYFAFLTGLMLVVTVAFVVVARRFNKAQAAAATPAS